MLGGRPVQVPVARPEKPARAAGEVRAGLHISAAAVYLGVAVVLGIVFAVWFFAFRQGEDHKLKELQPHLDDSAQTTPNAANPPKALNSQGGTPGSNNQTNPQPPSGQLDAVPPELNPVADPRKPGNNYLHIVILPWKDAEKAVAFLNKSGLAAFAVPDKKLGKIDPADAKAKNLAHLVFALEPIASGQYTASERKRQELVDRVKQIGKKWQREEKGPSDFGEPGWALFK